MTTTSEKNRPRYGFVRSDGPKDRNALYDIVDNGKGAERVMAYNVRHEPAIEIVEALNQREDLRRFSNNWR